MGVDAAAFDMGIGHHLISALLSEALRVSEDIAQVFRRQGDIHLRLGLCRLHGGVKGVMGGPEVAFHAEAVAHQDVQALQLLGKFGKLFHAALHGVLVRALQREHEGGLYRRPVRLGGEYGVACDLAGELNQRAVHIFQDSRLEIGGSDLCRGREGGPALCKWEQEHDARARGFDQPERDLRDHGQHALAAHDRPVALVGAQGRDRPVGQNYFGVCNIVGGAAVFAGAGAGSVGGYVAAYGSGLLARVGRIAQPVPLRLGLHVLEQDARLQCHRACRLVNGNDPVHSPEREHYPALYRYGAAGTACARATHRDRHAVAAANSEELGDLLCA